MSFLRIGLGAAVLATSLYAANAQAAGQQPEAQGSASQTQRSSTSSETHAKAKMRSATGDVKSIDSKALTLSNGEQFRLTNKTEYMRNGQKVSRDEVKPGEKVKASYEPQGNLAYATQISVLSNGK